uniref:Uncharacterized protein n=1 Tax=Cacopsylla melanoneura TaxID=428564 RepID=A0A8D9FEI6_9HEMI
MRMREVAARPGHSVHWLQARMTKNKSSTTWEPGDPGSISWLICTDRNLRVTLRKRKKKRRKKVNQSSREETWHEPPTKWRMSSSNRLPTPPAPKLWPPSLNIGSRRSSRPTMPSPCWTLNRPHWTPPRA